jgi:hypothetical protein
LTVNINKTKIVPFHRGRLKVCPRFYYGDKQIEVVNKYTYLGVQFSVSGHFGVFCKSMLNKGKGITESVMQILSKSRSDSWDSRMKLYESVVLPTILYSSEIWGPSCEEIIEGAQLYFFKRLLLLNKGTPSWALRLETGRQKLGHIIFKRAVDWLIKILNMPAYRYPNICLQKLLKIDTIREKNEARANKFVKNWVQIIKENFKLASKEVFWNGEISSAKLIEISKVLIYNHAEALRIEDRRRAIESHSFENYKFLNPNFEIGEQLQIKMPINKIRCITQLRMATSISMYFCFNGRGMYVDCTKICPICNMYECETVIHMLCKCPMYGEVREKYIINFVKNIVREGDQLMVLLSNLNEHKINKIYLYMLKVMEIREMICSIG